MLPLLDLHGVARLEFHTSILEVSEVISSELVYLQCISYKNFFSKGASRQADIADHRNRAKRRPRKRSQIEGIASTELPFG